MGIKHSDIDDDEIRVISSTGKSRQNRRKRIITVLIAILAAVTAAIMLLCTPYDSDYEQEVCAEVTETSTETDDAKPSPADSERAYTSVTDTVVNGVGLKILTPINATPSLAIGSDVLADTTAILIAQAADVRGDNKQIAGTYVLRGELVSRGEAKAGYCAIINGEISVGVADATSMFEEAIASDGYFFRQFPLVVGNQLVENKPKGKSLRRALADIGGRICIIVSTERLTFHDFAQALVDAGVRNAIYLVGADSVLLYRTDDDNAVVKKSRVMKAYDNINYIVWR